MGQEETFLTSVAVTNSVTFNANDEHIHSIVMRRDGHGGEGYYDRIYIFHHSGDVTVLVASQVLGWNVGGV